MVKEKGIIWLVNFHARPPHLEGYLKTIKFAQYLKEAGYETLIFASSNFHNSHENCITEKNGLSYIPKEYGTLKFVHIKTIIYRKSNLLRMLSMFQFAIRLFRIKKRFNRPKIIIHTAYVPFDNFVYFTAKSLKARYFVDIPDLWPESFVDVGLIRRNNPLLSIAYSLEKWLYKQSDGIFFCMQGGKDYIISRKWNKENNGPIDLKNVHWISNGIDLDMFNSDLINHKISDIDLENEDIFKVIYLGSIGLANNLIDLIKAAALLTEESKIKFFIYGDGDDRSYLEKYCINNSINNVAFKQRWIHPKYVPYVVSQSSLNILNYRQGIGKYGGSQSKLFQYLASGNPVLSNIDMKYCIIEKFHLGISKSFFSPKEYSEAILNIFHMSKEQRTTIRDIEVKLVAEYDYKFLTNKLISIIESVTQGDLSASESS